MLMYVPIVYGFSPEINVFVSFTEHMLECLFTDVQYYKIFGSWVI